MRRSRRGRGYTVLELVFVIVMIAGLAGTAVVGLSTQPHRSAMDDAIKLRRDIAHIQVLAVTWGVPLRLSTAAGGVSYSVKCRAARSGTPCTAVDTIPTDPATGAAFSTTLTNVTISPASDTFDFDSLGRPVSGTALVSTDPAKSYLLQVGGTTYATVAVSAITGFASVTF